MNLRCRNRRWIAAGLLPFALLGQARAEELPPTSTNSVGMTLVELPAGELTMGMIANDAWPPLHRQIPAASSNTVPESERPQHRVRLTRPFAVAAHEVTVGQFKQFVAATGYKTDAEKNGQGAQVFQPTSKSQVDRFAARSDASWRDPGFEQTDRHPVTCVSWRDADAFCAWLSKKEGAIYRLPTEAEWEYACRAGTQTLYSCGDDPDELFAHGNVGDSALEEAYPGEVLRQRADHLGEHDGDGYVFTAPVGTFRPNAWGLYDTHGNVWEWCRDRFHDRYYEDLVKKFKEAAGKKFRDSDMIFEDPQGPETTSQHQYGDWRSLRSGSWYLSCFSCRASARAFAEAGDSISYVGFRVVREKK